MPFGDPTMMGSDSATMVRNLLAAGNGTALANTPAVPAAPSADPLADLLNKARTYGAAPPVDPSQTNAGLPASMIGVSTQPTNVVVNPALSAAPAPQESPDDAKFHASNLSNADKFLQMAGVNPNQKTVWTGASSSPDATFLDPADLRILGMAKPAQGQPGAMGGYQNPGAMLPAAQAAPQTPQEEARAFMQYRLANPIPMGSGANAFDTSPLLDQYRQQLSNYNTMRTLGLEQGKLDVNRADVGLRSQLGLGELDVRRKEQAVREAQAYHAMAQERQYEKTIADMITQDKSPLQIQQAVNLQRQLAPRPVGIPTGGQRPIGVQGGAPTPGNISGMPWATAPGAIPGVPNSAPGNWQTRLPIEVGGIPAESAENMLLKIHNMDNGQTLSRNLDDVLQMVREKATDRSTGGVEDFLNRGTGLFAGVGERFRSGVAQLGLGRGSTQSDQVAAMIRNAKKMGRPVSAGQTVLDAVNPRNLMLSREAAARLPGGN